ncbi:MAG: hypothetical protein U0Y96_04625 [Candidatus Kapaibacterium sp.]|nr:hypothetical protein [Bacteroidota bacterium]
MGYIKEPNGVDFVINSRTITTEEEIVISNFINTYKRKHSTKKAVTKTNRVIGKKNKIIQ